MAYVVYEDERLSCQQVKVSKSPPRDAVGAICPRDDVGAIGVGRQGGSRRALSRQNSNSSLAVRNLREARREEVLMAYAELQRDKRARQVLLLLLFVTLEPRVA